MSRKRYSGLIAVDLSVDIGGYSQEDMTSFAIQCDGVVESSSDGDPCKYHEQFDAVFISPTSQYSDFFTEKFLEKIRQMALDYFTDNLNDYEL